MPEFGDVLRLTPGAHCRPQVRDEVRVIYLGRFGLHSPAYRAICISPSKLGNWEFGQVSAISLPVWELDSEWPEGGSR